MIIRTCAVLSLLGLAAMSADAAVYRWVDEQGQVHYSDKPRDQRATQLEFAPGSVGEASRRARAAEVQASQRAAEQRCQAARDELAQFAEAARLVERSANGDERELAPEERERLTAAARAKVVAACEGAE